MVTVLCIAERAAEFILHDADKNMMASLWGWYPVYLDEMYLYFRRLDLCWTI
jgi:hypothetical protein